MAKIRWFGSSRIETKALGLEGAPRRYTRPGEEMEVSKEALAVMDERYPGQFEVLDVATAKPAKAPEKEKKK